MPVNSVESSAAINQDGTGRYSFMLYERKPVTDHGA